MTNNARPVQADHKALKPTALPPLSLYVHLPWCIRKCPYCDFNSHPLSADADPAAYVEAVLADLTWELPNVHGRALNTVFIGGGTPSLFAAADIDRLLRGIQRSLPLTSDCEITLEANPGVSDAARFAGYRKAGVNRLSIGAQSFAAGKLDALGRIHGPAEIWSAVTAARVGGFENFNLDLMFGLPKQTPRQALSDLERALACGPAHLSWYQLTLEPHTPFYRTPPRLPGDVAIDEMQRQGLRRLAEGGFMQYEVSAFARPGRQCRHNLNYWTFGDYLGVGAGAHAKLTDLSGSVRRRWRIRHPRGYLAAAGSARVVAGERTITDSELGLEFALNVLRLVDGVDEALFAARSCQSPKVIAEPLARARAAGMLAPHRLQATALGWRYLDDLIAMFQLD